MLTSVTTYLQIDSGLTLSAHGWITRDRFYPGFGLHTYMELFTLS
jgi:hypothetical protein